MSKGFYFTCAVEKKQNLTILLAIPRESDHSILGQYYQIDIPHGTAKCLSALQSIY